MKKEDLWWGILFIVVFTLMLWMVSTDWYCENTLHGVAWRDECYTKNIEGEKIHDKKPLNQILELFNK